MNEFQMVISYLQMNQVLYFVHQILNFKTLITLGPDYSNSSGYMGCDVSKTRIEIAPKNPRLCCELLNTWLIKSFSVQYYCPKKTSLPMNTIVSYTMH